MNNNLELTAFIVCVLTHNGLNHTHTPIGDTLQRGLSWRLGLIDGNMAPKETLIQMREAFYIILLVFYIILLVFKYIFPPFKLTTTGTVCAMLHNWLDTSLNYQKNKHYI